jgi:hypothetical protein
MTLVFFTESAERAPSQPYVSFAVDDYHGPAVFDGHKTDATHYSPLPDFSWSMSHTVLFAYSDQAVVTVTSDDGSRISGTASGMLNNVFHQGGTVSGTLSGDWTCAIGERLPLLTTSSPTSFREISSGGLSMMIPASWSSDSGFGGRVYTSGTTVAFASPQPLLDPCIVVGNMDGCGLPLPLLRADSALVDWHRGFGLVSMARHADAQDFEAGIGSGWIEKGTCTHQLGDEQLSAVFLALQLEVTACIRGPDIARMENIVRTVMASTKPTS